MSKTDDWKFPSHRHSSIFKTPKFPTLSFTLDKISSQNEALHEILPNMLNLTALHLTAEDKQAMLSDLLEYRAIKDAIHSAGIAYWIITIILGLLAMMGVKVIGEVAMYAVWAGLLGSNVALVAGTKLYSKIKLTGIIRRYSSKDIVIGNLNFSEV